MAAPTSESETRRIFSLTLRVSVAIFMALVMLKFILKKEHFEAPISSVGEQSKLTGTNELSLSVSSAELHSSTTASRALTAAPLDMEPTITHVDSLSSGLATIGEAVDRAQVVNATLLHPSPGPISATFEPRPAASGSASTLKAIAADQKEAASSREILPELKTTSTIKKQAENAAAKAAFELYRGLVEECVGISMFPYFRPPSFMNAAQIAYKMYC